ncbi:hypothetical protein FBUS_00946 [Fasciolopsis buskii]|uniref:Cadherin domain-containing protein n=1 Tax=Fasciolopsis buskii TaxID=27845 RepID=A0A8E0RIP0_9TREM|nr:hypothetical protein FBUS_00946 [Fasciolopsis buski]
MLLTRIWDAVPTLIVLTLNLMTFASDAIQDITFRLFEHPPSKYLVGNIFQAARFQGHVRSVRLDSVHSQWLSLFHLDRPTGNLYTSDRATSALDRETICPIGSRDQIIRSTENKCVLNLLVSVNNRILIKVNIIVKDLNDNPPVFSTSSVGSPISVQNLSVDESSNVNSTKIFLKLASDLDEGGLQKIYYQLTPVDSPFYLVHKRRMESSHGLEELYLVPRRPLDHEITQEYRLNLTACDGPQADQVNVSPKGVTHCSTQQIHIAVQNIDDEKPVFLQKNYTVVIKDSTPVGQELITVKAIDLDAPPYNIVRYFSLPFSNTQNDLFIVEPISGQIRLANPIPSPGVYRFLVLATSDQILNTSTIYADYLQRNINDIYREPNIASVNLHVVNTNNHSPTVTLQTSKDTSNHVINVSSFLSSESVIFLQVPENIRDPTVLAYFRVTDPDDAGNARTHCVLLPNPNIPSHLSTLAIQKNLISLLDLIQVSRLTEHVSIYRLLIHQPMDAEKLTKKNRQRSPAYQTGLYGTIRVAGVVPIKVHCEDNGDPTLEGDLPVYLVIIDEDEHLPQLTVTLPNGTELQPHVQLENQQSLLIYNLALNEDVPVGNQIFRLTVTDEDIISQPLFELRGNASGHLWINQSTGIVFLKTPFDFEKDRTHTVELSVKEFYNFSSSLKKLTAKVNIELMDVNDNVPIFTYPNLSNQNVHEYLSYWSSYAVDGVRVIQVAEELPEGTKLGQISGTDPDSGPNAEIRYFIADAKVTPSSDSKTTDRTLHTTSATSINLLQLPTFVVNNEGYFWTTGRLDREKFRSIDLLVGAHDLGVPSLTSYTIIRIILTDVNDHEPKWQFPTDDDHLIVVLTDVEVGSTVTRVRAVDPDDPAHNGRVSYSLVLPNESVRADGRDFTIQCRLANDFFRIDENNGELMTRNSLHSLPAGFLDIWLMVRDSSINQRYSLAKLVAYLAKTHDEITTEKLKVMYQDKSQLIAYQLRMSKSLDHVLSLTPAHSELIADSHFWQQDKNYLPIVSGCVVAGLFLIIIIIILFLILWKTKRRRHLQKDLHGFHTSTQKRSRERDQNSFISEYKSSEVKIDSLRFSKTAKSKEEVIIMSEESQKILNDGICCGSSKFSDVPSINHVNSQVFQCRQEAQLQAKLTDARRETPISSKSTLVPLTTLGEITTMTNLHNHTETSHAYIPVNSLINLSSTIPLKILALSPASSYPMATCLSESDSDQSYLNFPNIITSVVPVCHVQPDFIPVCSSFSAASNTPCDSYLFEYGNSQVGGGRSLITSCAPIVLTANDPNKLYKEKLQSIQLSDSFMDSHSYNNPTVTGTVMEFSLDNESLDIRPTKIN